MGLIGVKNKYKQIIFVMLFRFHIFAIGLVLVAKPYILIKRSVYARLCSWECEKLSTRQESVKVRACAWTGCNFFLTGNSHNLQLKKWLISTTLLLCRKLPVGYWWAGKKIEKV